MGDDGFDPYAWHVGDPSDWGDGLAGVPDIPYMGYLHNGDDDEENDSDTIIDSRFIKRDEYSKKAWDYYLEFKEEDALYYIDLALDLDKSHSNNWNIKAIILEGMKRYQESEECYNRSLELSKSNVVYDNKARMLRAWAGHLLSESRKKPNGLATLEEALEKNSNAINALSQGGEESIERFLSQKRVIESNIKYEKEYQKNVETLKTYDKSELFTIAGRQFYKINMQLTPGMSLKLVKEPDNEFDKDAIAVYVEDKKIGYVANNANTKFELTSSASELQDKIKDVAQGEYLAYLLRPTDLEYPDIQFYIGRILK